MNTAMFKLKLIIKKSFKVLDAISTLLEHLTPLGDLLLRGWVAHAFWVSGMIKLQNWSSTQYLFQYEYSAPLLSPLIAAILATSIELCGPLLLGLGLFGRSIAGLMFLFNIIAVISYPDLGAAGLEQHAVWGIMLLVCVFHGPGTWSIDTLIKHLNVPALNKIKNRNSKT